MMTEHFALSAHNHYEFGMQFPARIISTEAILFRLLITNQKANGYHSEKQILCLHAILFQAKLSIFRPS